MESDLVNRACSLAITAQSTPNPSSYYLFDNPSRYAIFAFRGLGTLDDWYSGTGEPFGNKPVDSKIFPSLKSIGSGEVAVVNANFFQQFRNLLKEDFHLSHRFEDLLKDSQLSNEVRRAVSENRTVVFTGFSSGGPIAVFATILFLQQNRIPASCVTFGCPLVGNYILGHALRRENWAQHFVHFVMRYDIIPRLLLSPFSSITGQLDTVLPCFDSNHLESIARSQGALSSFYDVMKNVSALANHTACSFMSCTNSSLETFSSFIVLSPYRPFGTYVFCTGKKERMFTVKNPDAILQLLFYSLQLENREEATDVAYRSFKDHLQYEIEIPGTLGRVDVVDLENLPLQLTRSSSTEMGSIETVIKELGLSTRALLCLTAAKELEAQKRRNEVRIDESRDKIEEKMRKLEDYRSRGDVIRRVGYFDTFKLQTVAEDFEANVTRLELAGIWDEIIELLKRYELPDSFEGRNDWVEFGTRFRRLMEPLDISNFYRHLKVKGTGHYMGSVKGREPRPKRYRFTQRWLEHAEGKPAGHFSESCFWAEVEEYVDLIQSSDQKDKDRVAMLEENVSQWVKHAKAGLLEKILISNESTAGRWYGALPLKLRNESGIAELVKVG